MTYAKKNFEQLRGISGLSEELLNLHLGLYDGYVSNVEKSSETMEKMSEDDKLSLPEFAELKRRFGWEWNGMRLHEYYFSNLTASPKKVDEDLTIHLQIKKDFGSLEKWEKSFRATAAMRGIGWAILYFDPAARKLFNVWAGEHDTGHLAGAAPILVIDVFEHAYMLDYGAKRADYLEAVMKVIDWEVVGNRFDLASKPADEKPKGLDHLGCRC